MTCKFFKNYFLKNTNRIALWWRGEGTLWGIVVGRAPSGARKTAVRNFNFFKKTSENYRISKSCLWDAMVRWQTEVAPIKLDSMCSGTDYKQQLNNSSEFYFFQNDEHSNGGNDTLLVIIFGCQVDFEYAKHVAILWLLSYIDEVLIYINHSMKIIFAVLLCLYMPVLASKPLRVSKEQIQETFLEPSAVQDLYQMLKDTTEILDRAGIKYLVISGTALGVVRHQGLIPWDDDVDIAIFHEDEPKLVNLKPAFDAIGYHVMYDTNNAVMYNVSKKGNPPLDDRAELTVPFLDIFVVHKDPKTKRIVYSNWRTRDYFPSEWYPEDVFFPIRKGKFGDVSVNCINNPQWSFSQCYGVSWNTRGYIAPRHYKPNHTVPYEFEFLEYPEFLTPALPEKPLLDRVNQLNEEYFK